MQTHVLAMREGESLYHDVIIAPDHDTARRLFAMRMLKGLEQSLLLNGAESLVDYAPCHALDEDWRADASVTCSSCGGGQTRPLEPREMASIGISPLVHAGKAHVCLACASTWIATGTLAPLRERLEREAAGEIAGLDEYERLSLEDECL